MIYAQLNIIHVFFFFKSFISPRTKRLVFENSVSEMSVKTSNCPSWNFGGRNIQAETKTTETFLPKTPRPKHRDQKFHGRNGWTENSVTETSGPKHSQPKFPGWKLCDWNICTEIFAVETKTLLLEWSCRNICNRNICGRNVLLFFINNSCPNKRKNYYKVVLKNGNCHQILKSIDIDPKQETDR